jgi:hypothetical protein
VRHQICENARRTMDTAGTVFWIFLYYQAGALYLTALLRGDVGNFTTFPVLRQERRYGDPGQDHNRPIGLKKEPEPVARFEVQIFPHPLWDGGLILAAERAFHGAVPPRYTFYPKLK